jgi:5'-nucleotidase
VVVDPGTVYRVTVNSFLADGGDSFPVLVQGTNRLGGAVDTDALEAYLTSHAPVAPGPQNRFSMIP